MRSVFRWGMLLVIALFAVPGTSFAQASITGQVRDASGAVLPGVTVEVSSPALIEKVRSVVTDGTGQYRVEILPPGSYTVNFSLPGFSTFRREGIQLTGTFIATVNADLRVGQLEETITVTGESPIVDVQSATTQRVVDRELIENLPNGRSPSSMLTLIPGISVPADRVEVGGPQLLSGMTSFSVHGSSSNSMLPLEMGMTSSGALVPAGSEVPHNMVAYQEVDVTVSGSTAEVNAGGVVMNLIPKDGGNTLSGTLFMNGTTEALQSDNLTERLQSAGLRSVDRMRGAWDVNPGVGGPIVVDKLWFYAAARYAKTGRWIAGEFRDKNYNNPSVFVYEPDLNSPVSNDSEVVSGRIRLSWQATPKARIGMSYEMANDCNCMRDTDSTRSIEASPYHHHPLHRQTFLDTTIPLTSRFLVDGAAMHKFQRATRDPFPGLSPLMIHTVEQSTSRQYRARDVYADRSGADLRYRASMSYITGAHAFKVGINDQFGWVKTVDFDNNPLSYRLNNGLPNQLTMRAFPVTWYADVDHALGLFVQDRWTVDRLTLNAGLRYDWVKNSYPAQSMGPAPLAPTRNLSFPAIDNLSLHDFNPKLGAAYDVFGDGKTSLKASLIRSVEQYGAINEIAGDRNPINQLVNSTTRSWNDADRDYVPDCDLLLPDANGECGTMANRAFGTTIPERNLDPELLTGFGNRQYSWEFTVGGQREIISGVSAEVTYFRRSHGNLRVTDNLAVTAADFNRFSITAPSDSRLPDGGGYVISELYDVRPERFGQSTNLVTFAKNYGDWTSRWDGYAVNVNARLPIGVNLSGGVDSGRLLTDSCDVRAELPEIAPVNPHCRNGVPNTQVKALASYTIPRIDVLLSGTFQSTQGPDVAANFVALNAIIAPSLGRSLSGSAANATVNLVEPGLISGERLNQVDLRVGKILRFGDTRTTVNLDVYNALNADTVRVLNNAYASWQRPVTNLIGRLVKIGFEVQF